MFSALMDVSLSTTGKDFFLVERCLLQRYEQIHLAMFSMCLYCKHPSVDLVLTDVQLSC